MRDGVRSSSDATFTADQTTAANGRAGKYFASPQTYADGKAPGGGAARQQSITEKHLSVMRSDGPRVVLTDLRRIGKPTSVDGGGQFFAESFPETDSAMTVIEGVFDALQKQEIVRKLTNALVEIEGENMRPVPRCLVEELHSGDWGIGGNPLSTADVKAFAPPANQRRRKDTSASRSGRRRA